jgi:hypothetical protein
VGASLSAAITVLDANLIKQGYRKVGPGSAARSGKVTLGLRVCASVVLVEVEKGWMSWLGWDQSTGWGLFREGKVRVRRGELGCWAGLTDGSCNDYDVTSADFEIVAVE